MGVMSCNRPCCEQIMCDTYVDTVGYVCYECQSEFKDYLILVHNTSDLPEGQIRRTLETFMETEKGNFDLGDDTNVDDFFASYTPDRD